MAKIFTFIENIMLRRGNGNEAMQFYNELLRLVTISI